MEIKKERPKYAHDGVAVRYLDGMSHFNFDLDLVSEYRYALPTRYSGLHATGNDPNTPCKSDGDVTGNQTNTLCESERDMTGSSGQSP